MAVIAPTRRFRKRRRSDSDPSANRPLVSHRSDRGGVVKSDHPSSEDEIEVLPDRFDNSGRPVDGVGSVPSSSRRGRWTERRGDFEYRSPRPRGTQVQGTWGVAGTDPEQVERMMQNVTGLLAGEGVPRGMGGWLGLAGKLLGGVMAPGNGDAGSDEHNADDGGLRGNGEGLSRRGRERKDVIAYGGGSDVSRDERGKGIRRGDDHGYNDEDDDEHEQPSRRRRRKRREVD